MTNNTSLHLLHMTTDAHPVASILNRDGSGYIVKNVACQLDYEEALKLASFDLIIYENQVEGFKCHDAFKLIQHKKLDIPFIVISHAENEQDAIDAVKDGAEDYLIKGNMKRLPVAIAKAVKKYRQAGERKKMEAELENTKNYTELLHTKLAKAEQKIKAGESDMAQVQAMSKLGSWETDLLTMAVTWSLETYRIFELEDLNEKITHNKFLHFVHPDDRLYVDETFAASVGKDGPKTIEHRILTEKGTLKYVEECWSFIYDESCRPVRATGTIQDITTSTKANLLVKESEAKYRSLIDSSMDGILLTVRSGEILAANLAACILFKMTEEELLASRREDIVDVEDPRFLKLFEERNITGRARGELMFIRKDKSKFPGEISSVIFENAEGEERISIMIRDVSSRKNTERKLLSMSHELQDAVDGLNRIMDSSLDVICVVDGDLYFRKVSAASEAVWGYKPEEMIGQPLLNFVYKEDAQKTLHTAGEVMKGRQVSHFENRYIKKDGTLVSMEWTARWDEKDQMRYGVARDVTEKKKFEAAIEMERKRLEGLYLQAPSCMVILKGPEYVFEVANPLYLELIGRSDILGKKLRDVLPELSAQGNFEKLDEVYKSGNPYVANEALVRLDVNGTGVLVDKYLNFIYQAHRDINSEIDGIFFFAVDVTEQVISRKTIDESQKKYRQIVETSQEGIWLIDENEVTIFVNDRLCEMFEYSKEEMLGKDIYFFMDEEGQRIARDSMEKNKAGESGQQYYKYISKSQREIWANVSSNPLFEEGMYCGALGMLADVTEFKKAQDQIKKSEERYRNLFEQNLAGFCQATLDGKIINCNDAFAKMLKYDSPEDLMAVHGSALYFEQADRTHFLEKLTRSKNLLNYEGVAKCKDGTPMYFLENVSIHINPDTGIEYIDGIMLDISDKKEAELKLKESNERFLQVEKATFDVIWDWHLDTGTLYLGERYEELFGYPAHNEAENLQMWSDHIHPDDKERVLKSLEEKTKVPGTWTSEYRYVCADERIVSIVDRGVLLITAQGQKRMVGLMQDVTEMRALENLLRKATSLAHIGSWEFNPHTNSLYWSDVVKEIYEVDKDFEPQLESVLQFFIGAGDIEFLKKTLQDAILHGDFFDEEIEILTAKQNQRWIRINGEAEFINGKCLKVYGSIQDISQRKLSERDAIKALVEKNTILESIGDAFFAVDHDWNVTYWNNQAENILGKTKRETIGNNLWAVFSDSIDSGSYQKYHESIRSNQVVHFEDFYPTSNRWYEISAYPSENGLSVYFKDISARKQTDEAVRASEEVRKLIMDAAMDAIICINAANRVTVWNPQAERIFGWSEKETIGKILSDIIIPERLREGHIHGMSKYLETGHGPLLRKAFETTAINRLGDEIPIELSILPIKQGETEFFCAFIRDISGLKESEKKMADLHQNLLEQSKKLMVSNEELEKYAYVTSHDLQEPLRMVTSFLQLLQKKYENELDETAHKYINFAVDGAGRMKTLILDLLEFSRIRSGQEEHKVIPLNSVVSKTLLSLKASIDESNAIIYVPDLPSVPGNEFQLLQLFQNLLSNALKYKRDVDPVIEIGVSEHADAWQFSVRDNGIGIQPQYYDKIFIIFQRLHNKKDFKGTGIGLAICKKIVELHDGRIWVESNSAGSIFYFTLQKTTIETEKLNVN